VVRLVPGVVGDESSVEGDSFVRGLLDHPHYTRPAVFREMAVPEVLVGGHHAAIEQWRVRQRVTRTLARRPDLLARGDESALSADERRLLAQVLDEVKEHSS
jgi:tRNA (guanine37-N1)-methyltransferase